MDLHFPHLAARVFNAPLLVSPGKLDALLAVLGPRFLGQPGPALASYGEDQTKRLYDITPDGIAVVPISGTLVNRSSWISAASGLRSYGAIEEQVLEAATNPEVRGILLDVDSPGGEAGGLFDLVDVLYEAREMKPLWAVANEDAFSAAYGIASAAEQLYVTRTGGVGSVGVIAVHLDHSQADAADGLKYTVFRAGQYKAEHNSYEPLTEHAQGSLQAELDRLHTLFAEGVARNRGLSLEAVLGTEAQVYYGQAGVDVGFADRVGNFKEALEDLRAELSTNSLSRGGAAYHVEDKETNIMSEQKTPEAGTAQPAENKVIDLDEATRVARQEGQQAAMAYAKKVRQLCQLAQKPELADGFIDRELSVDQVREALLEAQAKADEALEVVTANEVVPAAQKKAEINPREIYERHNAPVAAKR